MQDAQTNGTEKEVNPTLCPDCGLRRTPSSQPDNSAAHPTSSVGAPIVDRRKVVVARIGPTPPPSVVTRLSERKVIQWFGAYLAGAFVLLQLIDALIEIWPLPVGLLRGITLALGMGVLPALTVAWYHGEMGRQKVCCLEAIILGASAALTAVSVWFVCFV